MKRSDILHFPFCNKNFRKLNPDLSFLAGLSLHKALTQNSRSDIPEIWGGVCVQTFAEGAHLWLVRSPNVLPVWHHLCLMYRQFAANYDNQQDCPLKKKKKYFSLLAVTADIWNQQQDSSFCVLSRHRLQGVVSYPWLWWVNILLPTCKHLEVNFYKSLGL